LATEIIRRKSLLYKSALGFHCVNHVQGCGHGCLYPCYAFNIAHHYGRVRSFEEWCRPKIVGNALELIDAELRRMRVKPDCVHLCLTTDPFMTGFPEVGALSLAIIETINRHGVPCSVLTKGLLPPELADEALFRRDNRYRISLVSLDERFRKRWEPGTTAYRDRIKALEYLHDHGCVTGVHMEPYPTPNIVKQKLEKILETIAFVDSIFFGGWNYNQVAGRFPGRPDFYGGQAEIVRTFCSSLGIDYQIDL
jgi:DNA repair photolyase